MADTLQRRPPVRSSRSVGRPPRPMPEAIPDTPEHVAQAILTTPPKHESEWEYLDQSPAAGGRVRRRNG